MPVAGANDLLCVAEEQPARFFHRNEQSRHARPIFQPPLDGAHPGVFQARSDGRGRELVASLIGCALGVVRQPVFIGVDADEIFQRAGDADFFVRFEFGQIDEHVGVHRRAAQQVFVARSSVFLVGFSHVERGAVESALSVVADEFTRAVQPDMGVSARVARKLRPGDGDSVNGVPFFRAQIEQRKFNTRKIGSQTVHQGVQSAVLANFVEGRIRLRRVAEGDRTAAQQLFSRPARDCFDHRGVSDDVVPLVRARKTLIVFLDPVWFEHHPVAGLDESIVQG